MERQDILWDEIFAGVVVGLAMGLSFLGSEEMVAGYDTWREWRSALASLMGFRELVLVSVCSRF